MYGDDRGGQGVICNILLIACIILVMFGFLLALKKMFPLPPDILHSADSFRALDRLYKKWDFFSGVAGIIFGVAGGYVSWWVCHVVCAWRASGLDGDYVLVPQKGICLMPVVPAAIATAVVCSLLLLRIILKSRFHELERYGSLKLGMHTRALLNAMAIVCTILALVGIALPFDTYMIMNEQGVRYNSLTGFREHSHDYTDIVSIQEIVRVKSSSRQEVSFVIHFSDGEVWNSDDTAELSQRQAEGIAEYLRGRTGLTVTRDVRKWN